MSTTVPVELATLPSRFVRKGWPETKRPYDRIVGITVGQQTTGLHADARRHEDRVSTSQIALPREVALRTLAYYNRFHARAATEGRGTNCARFVCDVAGIGYNGSELPQNVSQQTWLKSSVALDAIIKRSNEWSNPHRPLPAGLIGVLGTYVLKPEIRYTSSRVKHAFLSIGEGKVLQVNALDGHMAVANQGDTFDYLAAELARERPEESVSNFEPFKASDLKLFATRP